ncbi:MAG: hypothetical protein ABR961_13990 [Thermoanaerobaculaceae bacterium]
MKNDAIAGPVAADTDVRVPLLPIGMVGAATLLFEILLTRIFSVTMWYHFAFVAISLALFGIAASGVAVAIVPALSRSSAAFERLACAALGFGLAIPFAFFLDRQIPFIPFDVAGAGFWPSVQPHLLFFAKFLVLSVPFFFSGLTIALAFLYSPVRANHVYFGDLMGGGIGCCLVVPLLLSYSAPSAVLLSAALPLGAAAILFSRAGWKKGAVAAVLGVFAAIGAAAVNEGVGFADVKRVKSYEPSIGTELERPKLYERWHPISRVAVHPLEFSGTNASWFYAQPVQIPYPKLLEVTNDAGARTFIYPRLSHEELVRLFSIDLSDLVYTMTNRPSVLVVGVGGGKDILSALHLGAGRVTGVELNPLMIDVVQNKFAGFSGSPFDDPRVRIVIDEGRNFIASRDERYDVIKLSVTDTWAAGAAGAYALTESYLYTQQAFHDFLSHLSPGGFLSISRWYPQETLRLAALAAVSLREAGVENPVDRVLLARNDVMMTLIAKDGPLTDDDVSRFETGAKVARLTVVQSPRSTPRPDGSTIDAAHRRLISEKNLTAASSGIPLTVTPPTDDRPFFFNLVSFREATKGNYGSEGGFILQHGRALALLVGLLEVSLVVVALFVIAPLIIAQFGRGRSAGASARARLSANLYFVALGFGYLLVEIPLVQQFILFLGHPVYTLTVVLFSLLVSSAAGSLLAGTVRNTRLLRSPAVPLLAALAVSAFVWLVPGLLRQEIGRSLSQRILISVLLIAPVGVLLGMPFPAGLAAVRRFGRDLVSWAWAVNGAASVAAPVVAMIVAISSGFSTALRAGAFSYLAAAGLLWVLQRTKSLGAAAEGDGQSSVRDAVTLSAG